MKCYNDYIVNVKTLNQNLINIKSKLNKDVKVCAVVKGNAYGIGVEEICKTLKGKVDYFAVACLKEALKIREFDLDTEILILGVVDLSDIDLCYEKNITISVGDNSYLFNIRNKNIKIHLQVNSGLNRFGYKTLTDFKKGLKYIRDNNLNLVGVYSHFATKSTDVNFINKQFLRFVQFKKIVNDLKTIFHISNSYAITHNNNFNLNMVRSGFLLYGFMDNSINCNPIVEIKSKLIRVFDEKRGDTIGYDRSYKVSKSTKIGVVPIGYADGLNRRLSNKFKVLINGIYYKIVGYICMDVFMIDLENSECVVGDEVVLLGKSRNKQITLQDYAKLLDTSPYEVLLNFRYNRMNYLIKN